LYQRPRRDRRDQAGVPAGVQEAAVLDHRRPGPSVRPRRPGTDGQQGRDTKTIRWYRRAFLPKWVFWFQFKIDATSKLPWVLWPLAAIEIARGLVYGYSGHVVFGGGVLVGYFLLFVLTCRHLRNAPAVVAVIDSVTPHRWAKNALMGVATTAEGEIRVVAMSDLVGEFVGGGRQAEVVFLYDPSGTSCLVMAARAVPATEHELHQNGPCSSA
jgi:hypothetical protein